MGEYQMKQDWPIVDDCLNWLMGTSDFITVFTLYIFWFYNKRFLKRKEKARIERESKIFFS